MAAGEGGPNGDKTAGQNWAMGRTGKRRGSRDGVCASAVQRRRLQDGSVKLRSLRGWRTGSVGRRDFAGPAAQGSYRSPMP